MCKGYIILGRKTLPLIRISSGSDKTAYQRLGDPVTVHHDDLVVAGLVAHSPLVHVPEHLQI